MMEGLKTALPLTLRLWTAFEAPASEMGRESASVEEGSSGGTLLANPSILVALQWKFFLGHPASPVLQLRLVGKECPFPPSKQSGEATSTFPLTVHVSKQSRLSHSSRPCSATHPTPLQNVGSPKTRLMGNPISPQYAREVGSGKVSLGAVSTLLKD